MADALPPPLDGLNVSRESFARLDAYVKLLLRWQERINLIGPSTVEHVWSRHIADALQPQRLIPVSARAIADLGTGAGIPGLVVAINSGISTELYESNGKKAAFLSEAIRHIGIDARVHQERLENILRVPKVDILLARGLAPLPRLLDLAAPFMAKGAVALFHKGQDVDAELTEAAKTWRLDFRIHPSQIDSRGVILEIKGAVRVTT